MLLPGREWQEGYRFGFNGQEKDDDIYGNGKLNTAEFWEYETRIGRRWNLDPRIKPWQSGFLVFGNDPITFIDKHGAEDYYNYKGQFIGTYGEDNGKLRIIEQETYDKLFKEANPPHDPNLYKPIKAVATEILISNSYEISIQSIAEQEVVMQKLEQRTESDQLESAGFVVLDISDKKKPIVRLVEDPLADRFPDHIEFHYDKDLEDPFVYYVKNRDDQIILATIHSHPQDTKGSLPQYGPSIGVHSDVSSAQSSNLNYYVLDRERYVARHSGSHEMIGERMKADIARDAINTHKSEINQ